MTEWRDKTDFLEGDGNTLTDQKVRNDIGDLKALSIAYYVVAGLTGLMSCLFLLHVGFGLGMVFHPEWFKSADGPPPQAMGYFFAAIGAVFVLLGWAFAGALAYAGRCLQQHRKRRFCFVMAVISCLNAPLGTVLGVFTLVVLNRPSVIALFDTPTNTESPISAAISELDDPVEMEWKALESQSIPVTQESDTTDGATISLKQPENEKLT